MTQLQRHLDEIHAAKGEVFVIGNGAPNFIAGFRETTKFTGAVYTDPSLEVYRAAQLKRGVLATVNLGSAVRTIGSLARGFRQGRKQGDQTQQGGALVVAPDGRVILHQISSGPGDNADPAALVQALRSTMT